MHLPPLGSTAENLSRKNNQSYLLGRKIDDGDLDNS